MFDLIGTLILIALILAFGFLTFRARKARNRWLNWIGTLLAGLVTLISAALLILALVGFWKLNTRFDNPVEDIQIARTPEQIVRGEKLANLCVSCQPPATGCRSPGATSSPSLNFRPLVRFTRRT
jgi:hypothetical protein